MPKEGVTAVVPLYQGQRFIAESLESLFADPSISQVIVVDDGSTDDGPTIVSEQFPQAVLKRQANAGVSSARNIGLKAAETEYILFLDQDDQLVTGALKDMVDAAQRESADLAYGDYLQIDEYGEHTCLIRQSDVSDHPAAKSLEECCSASVCCCFRRNTLVQIGGFDEAMIGCEDWDVYTRLALSGAKFAHVPKPVFKFRYHANSTSKRFWLMWKCFRQYERKHMESTLALPDGKKLLIGRRTRFLNDNLKFLYGVQDLDASWIRRRINRTVHFGKIIKRDPHLALELVRRALARLRS